MPFNGSEGKPIPLDKAQNWTRAYREANPTLIQSCFFGRDIINTLLEQHGSVGIRIYYALDGSEPQLLAVGVNEEENDQLDNGCIVADDTPKGPPCSGQANVLNS
jgi:hypothetical protein